MSKVDVEEFSLLGDHHIVIVSITDAQDVSGHTVPGAGVDKVIDGESILIAVCPSVLLLQPIGDGCHPERSGGSSVFLTM